MDSAEFILVSIATKQSMKPKQLAEKSQLFQRVLKKKVPPKKWQISKILQRASPLNFGQNCPF